MWMPRAGESRVCASLDNWMLEGYCFWAVPYEITRNRSCGQRTRRSGWDVVDD